MPSPEDLERLAKDCDITPYRSSGPGGQKKNKTESSIRILHRPSGITRLATKSRSQLRNKEAALESLWLELQRRARKRKPRVPTKPTGAAKKRRLDSKRRDSDTKKLRRKDSEE